MALTLVTSDLIHGLDYSKLTGTIPTWNQNTTGNAATATLAAGATILATARNIGGVSFNGSAAINLPGVNTAGNQNTSGNAGTVTNGVYTVGDQTIGGVKTFSSNTTFSGSVGIGSTGIFAGTNAILNLQGIGVALKNDKNGSDNNWSYIQNTGTGSNSDINFYTGNNASALNLSHSGDATFGGKISSVKELININSANGSRSLGLESDATGNVWIGTGTTAATINLVTGNSTNGLPSTNGVKRLCINREGTDVYASYSGSTFPFRVGYLSGSTYTPTFVINDSGNVGIGVAAGSETLKINQTTGNQSALYAYTTSVTTGQSYGGTIQAGTNASDASFRVFAQGGGTSYFYVRGDGNVGIGTNSPSAKLQIHTTTNAGNPEVAAFLVNKSTTTNTEVRLAFAAHTNDVISTGRYSYISAKNTSGSNGQDLIFATNATGASATPKLTISSGGNVGIAKLPSTFRLDLETTSGGNGLKITRGTADFQVFQATNGASYVGTGNADTLHLITGGTSKLNISSAGVATFDIDSDSKFIIGNGGTNAITLYSGSSQEIYMGSNGSYRLRFKTDGNIVMDNGGKLGIGTASPLGKLSIVSSGGTDGLRINAGTGSSNNGLVVNNEADNATLFYVRGNGDSAIGGNFTVNNKFYQNSVGRICNSGFVAGNASFYIDYTVASQSSLKVTAVMNHYGYIPSYGCARFSLVAIGPVITTVDISTTATGNGGSWGISRINATTLRVTKNAGTYAGGGYWFIEITGTSIT